MTKKLTINERKFNKLVTALNNTWNCTWDCLKCPFRQMDDDNKLDTSTCGAVLIRNRAERLFEKRNPKAVRRFT